MEHSMASPAAPATEPAAVPVAESVPASPASDLGDFGDFDAAFSPAALSASSTVADPAPAAPVGEPVEAEAGTEPPEVPASTPDGDEPGTESDAGAKPSRRAEREAERQAELAAARTEWEQERQRSDQLERENAALREAEQQRLKTYVARIGDEAEFHRLNALPSSDLSYEDQVKLDTWKTNRVDLDLYEKDAWNRVANHQATEAQRVANKPGVDPDVVKKTPSFGAICEHFYEAGSKTVRAELSDRIAALEADNHALRAQRVGQARQPEAGGNSPPSTAPNPNSWNPDDSADELMAKAFSPAALRRAS